MKSKLWIVVIICFLFTWDHVFANGPSSPIDQLNTLSDEALQLTKSHRYEDAKKILEVFSDKFSSVTLKEQPLTMDELRIITVAHDEAVEATTNATMDPEVRVNRVTKFRLVMDAISSTKEPLWTQMETPVMSSYNGVKEAVLNGDREEFQKNLNSFLALYEVVYPSMKIDVPSEKIQQFDTKVQFIDQYRMDVLHKQEAQKELLNLESELKSMFDNLAEEDETDPSIWWIIISTGSIIIITLSYAGWRKYKGEKEKSKTPSR
jgi:sporulation protein YpjB